MLVFKANPPAANSGLFHAVKRIVAATTLYIDVLWYRDLYAVGEPAVPDHFDGGVAGTDSYHAFQSLPAFLSTAAVFSSYSRFVIRIRVPEENYTAMTVWHENPARWGGSWWRSVVSSLIPGYTSSRCTGTTCGVSVRNRSHFRNTQCRRVGYLSNPK